MSTYAKGKGSGNNRSYSEKFYSATMSDAASQ